MRKVLASSIVTLGCSLGFACSGDVSGGEALTGDTATGGASAAAGTTQSAAGGTTSSSSAGPGSTTSGAAATSAGSPTNSGTTTSNAATSSNGAGNASTTTTSGGGGTDGGPSCTDTPPDDRETCATWAEWGECGADWLAGYCELSCGRCTTAAATNGGGGAGTTTTNATTTTGNTSGGNLGNDNPYDPIQGGQSGFATRYWDCCKPSCGWSGNANPTVKSCDQGDNNLGANDQQNSCEANGQSGAFTCHSMAPWAHSNVVSYGFAAVNGVGCGTCFQIEFPGTSQRGGNDPGSAALSGKTMVVMATNVGGIEQNQFDLLVPGGGVGDFNGCSGQWGVDNGELGAQYGGFLSVCREQNGFENHDGVKSCVRDKCDSVFGSRGLTELYDGCMWFVDWYQAADNPDIRFQQINCPQELTSIAY
jgi:hypothetical protein